MKQLNVETLTRIAQGAYFNVGGYMSTIVEDCDEFEEIKNRVKEYDSFEEADMRVLCELERSCRLVAETFKVFREALGSIYNIGTSDENNLVEYLNSEEYKNVEIYIEED